MLTLLDVSFFLFHTGLMVFNLTGWIWMRTRRLHLAVISLTVLSWFGLGMFYGIGYCPCTDWHWQVKRALGEVELPVSYVKYYLDRFTGLDLDPMAIDVSVAVLGVGALLVSLVLNLRDWKRTHARA
ncbi:MAG: DUF2784 domain-containing protein [Rhodothermales bacterium]|nr:DUF2784 domain-containing protein [Rhodothermales bacterium]